MKSSRKVALTLIGLVLMVGVSFSQLAEEQFSYSTGQLTGLNGGGNVSGGAWVNFSGSGNPLQVTSGSLSYPGYSSSGVGNKIQTVSSSASSEDAYMSFPTQGLETTTYCSFLLSVTDTVGLPLNSNLTGDYFVALLPSTSTTNFASRISIRKGASGNTFQLGIRAMSTNAGAWVNTDLPVATAHLVVFSYNVITGNTNDVASLWVNPILSGPEPAADVTQVSLQATDIVDVARFAVRQGGVTTPSASIDGIRIGSTWSDVPLPVQIAGFGFTLSRNSEVALTWATSSEINNYGFEVQRSIDRMNGYQSISSLIPGHGTTNVPQTYAFTDKSGFTGAYYRLKQIDLDQSVHFTEPIQVTGATGVNDQKPIVFGLEQNYPNPFNPGTAITYSLSATGRTTLIVYDVLGNEIATLVNAEQGPGTYSVHWYPKEKSSGVYFYRLTSGNTSELRRMMLLK